VQDYAAVARSLTGYYSLELVVDAPSGWLDPAFWPALDRLQQAVEDEPGVARVLSPLDLLKQLNHGDRMLGSGRYELPASRADAAALVDGFDPLGGGERSRLVADGGRSVRLSALVNVMPASELRAIEGRARQALAELPAPLSGHTTGLVLQLVDAQLRLVSAQIRSFGFAFLTVFACLLAGLRSWKLMAAGVLPNVIPVLVVFAVMDHLGVALDPATVMTASVVIGIAVDDTAHLLSGYRGERIAGRGAAEAIRSSFARTGPAMLAATASACAGFFALSRSAFVPIRWFGLLSGLAMLVGIVAEVFVVPATLVLAERLKERRA
jgi:predicted RND superfamily exporter protein